MLSTQHQIWGQGTGAKSAWPWSGGCLLRAPRVRASSGSEVTGMVQTPGGVLVTPGVFSKCYKRGTCGWREPGLTAAGGTDGCGDRDAAYGLTLSVRVPGFGALGSELLVAPEAAQGEKSAAACVRLRLGTARPAFPGGPWRPSRTGQRNSKSQDAHSALTSSLVTCGPVNHYVLEFVFKCKDRFYTEPGNETWLSPNTEREDPEEEAPTFVSRLCKCRCDR